MRYSLRLLLVLLAASAMITACKKKVPGQAKYIPKNASVVFSISPKNLQSKLQNSKLNMDSLFETFKDTSTANSTGIKSWDDVKNSGIDLSENIFLFVNNSGSIMNGTSTSMGVVGALKDATALENFIKKHKTGVTIKKDKNYTYAALEDGFVVGWNEEVVIVTNVTVNNYAEGTYNTGEGTQAQKLLTTLFDQSENESIASVPEFRDLLGEQGDVLFWSNSSSSIASIPFIGMTKAGDLLKDMYSAGTINFEDGEVVMSTKTYAGKDLDAILQKYKGPEVDMDMVNKYPSSKINGFAVFSFNPQIIAEVIRFIGAEGTVNQQFQQLGFTIDDVLKAFKGDFAVVFSDFAMAEKANPYYPSAKMKTPTARLLVNAKIGDKAAYDKVMSKLASTGEVVEVNGQYVPKEVANNPDGYVWSVDDKNIIVASDKALLDQYKAGNAKSTIADDVEKDVKGTATSFYLNINSVLTAIPRDTGASMSNKMLDLSQATFKDVRITMDNYSNKSLSSKLYITTGDAKENSLATMVKYFSALAGTYKSMASESAKELLPQPEDSTEDVPDTSGADGQ